MTKKDSVFIAELLAKYTDEPELSSAIADFCTYAEQSSLSFNSNAFIDYVIDLVEGKKNFKHI